MNRTLFATRDEVDATRALFRAWVASGWSNVDPVISQLLQWFNAVDGVATIDSCSGHDPRQADHRLREFYISFVCTEMGFSFLQKLYIDVREELVRLTPSISSDPYALMQAQSQAVLPADLRLALTSSATPSVVDETTSVPIVQLAIAGTHSADKRAKAIRLIENSFNRYYGTGLAANGAVMKMHIRELNLSANAYNALINEGIRNIEKLLQYTRRELQDLRGLGDKALLSIELALKRYNLTLNP